MMLVTPPEPKIGASRPSFADVQKKFSEYTWDRPKPSTFADPFAPPEGTDAAIPIPSVTPVDESHSPASRKAELSRRGSEENDPPSPTRRPSLPRYRSTPDLYTQEPTGLNIHLGNPETFAASPFSANSASSSGPHSDTSTNSADSRSSAISRGSVVPMSRSVDQTAGTLASLFPRLSFAPLALLAPRRLSAQGSDVFEHRDNEQRQSMSSRRGSWAQISAVDFPPPITMLGREFRSRFNSVDSASQRGSDAASLFGSLQENDWLNPGGSQSHGWSRKSSDWSSSSVRRGSDPHSRRRSSLARIAYANMGSRSPWKSLVPPSQNEPLFGLHSSTHSHRGSTHSGSLREYQFGASSPGHESPLDRNPVAQEPEEFGPHDWHTRRRSWAEV